MLLSIKSASAVARSYPTARSELIIASARGSEISKSWSTSSRRSIVVSAAPDFLTYLSSSKSEQSRQLREDGTSIEVSSAGNGDAQE
jgi:hypothetical protein